MDVRVVRRVAAIAAALLPLAAPALAQASYADHILATPGLEWYVPLDEPEGTSVGDVGGSPVFGRAGTQVALGQPGALAEPGNRAARFLGGGHDAMSESHIALVASRTDDANRPYSFEAWVNVERTDGRSLRIFSDEDQRGGMLVAARDGRLVFSRYATGVRATTISAPVALGAWTHVLATYDGARMRLFTDGAERASALSAFPIIPARVTYQAQLGVRSDLFRDGRFWLEFRGSIDEVAFYSRALTPCEAADHHRAGTTPPNPSSGEMTICGWTD
jgi:hypothetical protein